MAQIINNNRELGQGQMICKLALNYKKISNDQYIKAIDIHKKENEDGKLSSLSEILLKYDFLSREDMKFLYSALDLLTLKRKAKRFGSIAVKQGLLKEEELVAAIKTQKTERKRIGSILRDLGVLTEEQCDEIIDIQKMIVVKLPSYHEIMRRSEESDRQPPVIITTVEVNISEDELVAVAVLPEDGRIVDAFEIIKAMNESEICFGTITEDEITENLKYVDLGLSSFIVAKGQPGVPGTPGNLSIHFKPRETEPGMIDEQGKIDYKNRGEIPVAVTGELLAERDHMVSSVPGTTIFGKKVPVEDVEDVEFICGEGTSINETGEKIFAELDGEPCLNLDGTISILKEMVVENVDYETGNLNFDGNIIVRGAIKSDFQVVGRNIEACEVLGAEINIDGDLEVEQGIIGAEIRATGNVKATYLKSCTIICAGDIKIEKEIIDSDVVAGGSCFVNGGILSTKLCVGQSVAAVSIGSDSSGSNHIEIGMGEAVSKRLTEKLEKKTYLKGKEVTFLLEKRDDLVNMTSITNSVIKGIKNQQKKSEEEYESVKTLVERMEKKTQKPVTTGRQRMEENEIKINSAIEIAETLKQDNKYVAIKLEGLDAEIKEKAEENVRCLRKINKLNELVTANVKKSKLRVFESIRDGTKILSKNASLILKNDFSDVTIREVKSFNPVDSNEKYSYKLEISSKKN